MVKEVSNKQIIFKDYINGFPKESDMVLETSTIKLEVPEGCNGAVSVKNFYLSCDPYMRSRMSKLDDNYVPIFTPGSVSTLAYTPPVSSKYSLFFFSVLFTRVCTFHFCILLYLHGEANTLLLFSLTPLTYHLLELVSKKNEYLAETDEM